jgi:hypothetical protein
VVEEHSDQIVMMKRQKVLIFLILSLLIYFSEAFISLQDGGLLLVFFVTYHEDSLILDFLYINYNDNTFSEEVFIMLFLLVEHFGLQQNRHSLEDRNRMLYVCQKGTLQYALQVFKVYSETHLQSIDFSSFAIRFE